MRYEYRTETLLAILLCLFALVSGPAFASMASFGTTFSYLPPNSARCCHRHGTNAFANRHPHAKIHSNAHTDAYAGTDCNAHSDIDCDAYHNPVHGTGLRACGRVPDGM